MRAARGACGASLLVAAASTDLRIKADAARASGDVRAANGLFQEALRQYPEDAALRVRWGELFLATHQNNEAVELFQRRSRSTRLRAGEARPGEGRRRAIRGADAANDREVIEERAGRQPAKRTCCSRSMSLEDGAIEAGDEELDKALAIAEKQKLPPLEIYALKASRGLLRASHG